MLSQPKRIIIACRVDRCVDNRHSKYLQQLHIWYHLHLSQPIHMFFLKPCHFSLQSTSKVNYIPHSSTFANQRQDSSISWTILEILCHLIFSLLILMMSSEEIVHDKWIPEHESESQGWWQHEWQMIWSVAAWQNDCYWQ